MKNIGRFIITLSNIILLNIGFILAFLLRYGGFPTKNFTPYKESWPGLTILYLAAMAVCGGYNSRFRSSWELFTKTITAMLAGTAASFIFMYIFRARWEAFPTSIFVIAMPINLLLLFKVNQWFLRKQGNIKKNVIVIGSGSIKGLTGKTSIISRVCPDKFRQIKLDLKHIDQIIIADEIADANLIEYLTMLAQRFKVDIVYTPVVYIKLIKKRLKNNDQNPYLKTFEGERPDAEEFFIRLIDVMVALFGLIILLPVMGLVALAIKITSPGPVIYKQERVGKDSKLFTLYKFRTMVNDAEKATGPTLAQKEDPRFTPIGAFLRKYRIDELPPIVEYITRVNESCWSSSGTPLLRRKTQGTSGNPPRCKTRPHGPCPDTQLLRPEANA